MSEPRWVQASPELADRFCRSVNVVLLPLKLAIDPQSIEWAAHHSKHYKGPKWRASARALERPGYVVPLTSPDNMTFCMNFPLRTRIAGPALKIMIDLDRRVPARAYGDAA